MIVEVKETDKYGHTEIVKHRVEEAIPFIAMIDGTEYPALELHDAAGYLTSVPLSDVIIIRND